jgi:rubrerythrin
VTIRDPAPPPIVRAWIERWAEVSPEAPHPESLDGALRALQEALQRPGRSREAAEALLAADALLTYVLEDASDAPDSEALVDASFRTAAASVVPAQVVELLFRARAREQDQVRFYRALAVEADQLGRTEAVDRLNDLLADEQHHVSRLSARLLELGGVPAEATDRPAPRAETPPVSLEGWEIRAQEREGEELRFYEAACGTPDLDDRTRRLLEEIRDSEAHHHRHLGGKWMPA